MRCLFYGRQAHRRALNEEKVATVTTEFMQAVIILTIHVKVALIRKSVVILSRVLEVKKHIFLIEQRSMIREEVALEVVRGTGLGVALGVALEAHLKAVQGAADIADTGKKIEAALDLAQDQDLVHVITVITIVVIIIIEAIMLVRIMTLMTMKRENWCNDMIITVKISFRL